MQDQPTVAYGLCQCGCGQPAPLAPHTHKRRGWVRGEPLRYVHGHNRQRNRVPDPTDYRVEAHGYETPCWIWQGYVASNGYGAVSINQRAVWAHRWYYEHYVGQIPEGLTIDHLCRVTACINPDHLEPVTMAENLRRAGVAQTHCRHGHEFTPENTYRRPGLGHRMCRICRRK